MGLSREESITKYGTERYTGWNEPEAGNDAKALGISAGTGSQSSNPFSTVFNQMSGSIDKYVQDLMDFAKDDYDFAAKWIEDQYTDATGADDQARKDFLKSVANELENRIGTIAYDYGTKKYRLEEDTTKALTRLNEDEQVARKELGVTSQLERENQNSVLNQRGIIQGTRENATGLASRDIGLLEGNIQKRFDALDRVMGRDREDITTASERGLEDITTSARRAGEGAVDTHNYSLEEAERTRKKTELEAQTEAKKQKDYLASLGAYLS